jgi:hypothetical protein
VFGAMFAPRPERAAAELFRVVRPGGTVAMANWRPEGFQARFFEVLNKYRPPEPESIRPSSLWGTEETVHERFGPYADDISVEATSLPWGFESLQAMAEFFQSAGPRQSSVPEEKRQAMLMELLELVQEHNQADDGSVAIESAYSNVVARKKS